MEERRKSLLVIAQEYGGHRKNSGNVCLARQKWLRVILAVFAL